MATTVIELKRSMTAFLHALPLHSVRVEHPPCNNTLLPLLICCVLEEDTHVLSMAQSWNITARLLTRRTVLHVSLHIETCCYQKSSSICDVYLDRLEYEQRTGQHRPCSNVDINANIECRIAQYSTSVVLSIESVVVDAAPTAKNIEGRLQLKHVDYEHRKQPVHYPRAAKSLSNVSCTLFALTPFPFSGSTFMFIFYLFNPFLMNPCIHIQRAMALRLSKY